MNELLMKARTNRKRIHSKWEFWNDNTIAKVKSNKIGKNTCITKYVYLDS